MKDLGKKIDKIIDKAASSFIAYEDEDEVWPVVSVKLDLIKRDGVKEIWFSTHVLPEKVEFLKQNRDCNIYFLHKSFFKGVSLAGTIDVEAEEPYDPQRGDGQIHCILKFGAVRGWYYTTFKTSISISTELAWAAAEVYEAYIVSLLARSAQILG